MASEKELENRINQLEDEISILKNRLARAERKTSTSAMGELSEDIANPFNAIGAGIEKLNADFSKLGRNFSNTIINIREAATDAASKFGTGLKNYENISQEIAKILPDLTRLGYSASEIGKIQEEFTDEIKTNVILSSEALKNIGVLDRLGADGAVIAANFKTSAQSVSGMLRELEVAGKIAGDYGVNTSKIFSDIEKTMETTNQYRFENGVEGISRMAAQTAIMGISFEKVVGFADRVMDPQGAIETVAAMQRLGVTVSGLQDPFKLMYMAQSDMEGLTQEIGKSVSNLATFNKETGKLEIPPSARMQMKELEGVLGLSSEEMNRLVSAQAKFNEMSTDFQGLGVSEEDQMMIANLAEFSKERGQFEVKVGGETKAVSELKPEDLEALKQRPKTLEDAAMQQLDFISTINNNVNAIREGLIGTATATKAQFDTERLARASFEVAGGEITKIFRETNINKEINDFTKAFSGSLDDLLSAFSSGDAQKIGSIFKNLGKIGEIGFDETVSNFKTSFYDSLEVVPDKIKEALNEDNLYTPLVEKVMEAFSGVADKITNIFDSELPEQSKLSKTNLEPKIPSQTGINQAVENKANLEKKLEIEPPTNSDIIFNQKDFIIKSLPEDTIKVVGGTNIPQNGIDLTNILNNKETPPTVNQPQLPETLKIKEVETPKLQILQQDELLKKQPQFPEELKIKEINDLSKASEANIKDLIIKPTLENIIKVITNTPSSSETEITNILNNQTNNTQALTSIQPILNKNLETLETPKNINSTKIDEKELRVKFDPFIVKLEGDGKSIEMALQDNVVRDKIIDIVGKAMTSDYNTMGRPILGIRS